MRLTPIPKEELPTNVSTIIMAPPDGDLLNAEISPCEMAVAQSMKGLPVFMARFVLEDGDLEKLQNGVPIWISFWGQVTPFNARIATLEEHLEE